jgi:hypothetical protein
LLTADKSEISKEARENLSDLISGNDLQKLLLLQHEVNKLEKKISDAQYQNQIEILPPSYN